MTHDVEAVADFAREHMASRDIDPVYPVARYLQRTFGEDRKLWHSLVYVAYYNIASAETAFDILDGWLRANVPSAIPEWVLRLSTGTERRNLRVPWKLARHLGEVAELHDIHGSFEAWLRTGLSTTPELAWQELDERLTQPWGNGRWASYKTREVLWKVNDFPIAAPDTGMANSSGPRDGLAIITQTASSRNLRGNDPETVARLENMAWWLRDHIADVHHVDLAIEELETVLCDFHALADGRYYVGHDIDQMLEQTLGDRVDEAARRRIFEARAATLPHEYLGELNGWYSVDRERKHAYRDRRELIVR